MDSPVRDSLRTGKVGHLNHTNISRNAVTKVDNDDITRYNLIGGDTLVLAIAADLGVAGKHGLQCVSCLLSGSFL
jgi:hypothetical protein